MENEKNKVPQSCNIDSVMPRIKHFVCEHGYTYDEHECMVNIGIHNGYTYYYFTDRDTGEVTELTPVLYGA